MLPLYQQAPALSVRAGQHHASRCDSQLAPFPTPSLSASPVLFMTQRKSSISCEFISTTSLNLSYKNFSACQGDPVN